MKEREIFGGLVPYDRVWRTGANRNSTIEISDDFYLQGSKINKGKYSILTIPRKDQWDFILYNETTNWDAPDPLDSSKMVAVFRVTPQSTSETYEALSIGIGDFTNYEFDLVIQWDRTRLVVPFQLDTKEIMAETITDVLSGPKATDYYSAAVYQMESEKDYAQGLKWITQAIDMQDKPAWWYYRVKAILLVELNKWDEAKINIDKGLKIATEINNEYGLSEFNRLLKLVKNK